MSVKIKSKAYTINRLISEISGLSVKQTSSVKLLATALSPRAGTASIKMKVLNNTLRGNLYGVVVGTQPAFLNFTGGTGRARLISALRNIKKHNF